MMMRPYPKHPHHAILNLEGGPDEVVHIRAFKKDLRIEIRIDESQTGVVIKTPDGMYRQEIPGRQGITVDETDVPIVQKKEDINNE